MQLFDTVKFDFKQNIVHLGNTCVKCITLRNRDTVRINECTTVKARSEQVINVQCSKCFSMLCVDFEPRQIPGVKGVFVSKARVLPNMD